MTREERDAIVRNLESRMTVSEQSAYQTFCSDRRLQNLDPFSEEFNDILRQITDDSEVIALMEMGFHGFLDATIDRIFADVGA